MQPCLEAQAAINCGKNCRNIVNCCGERNYPHLREGEPQHRVTKGSKSLVQERANDILASACFLARQEVFADHILGPRCAHFQRAVNTLKLCPLHHNGGVGRGCLRAYPASSQAGRAVFWDVREVGLQPLGHGGDKTKSSSLAPWGSSPTTRILLMGDTTATSSSSCMFEERTGPCLACERRVVGDFP